MNYTAGLTYKSRMSKGIKELLSQGALVHMFEFETGTVRPSYIKNTDENPDRLLNLANAFLGKNTGSYTTYRKKLFFNEEKQILQALPCSGIKTGFPMFLYRDRSNVGVLLDPEKVKFLAVQTRDSYSEITGDDKIKMLRNNTFDDEKLRKANFNTTRSDEKHAVIPSERSERKSQELYGIFKKHFWDLYSGGLAPGEKGFMKNIRKAAKKNCRENGTISMLTEILVNVPADAIKGIVVYSINKSCDVDYDKSKHRGNGYFDIQGVMLANLFKEYIQAEKGLELPIIHYHSNFSYTFWPDEKISAPVIREVNLESRKIASALQENYALYCTYEHYIGAERTKNLALGRTAGMALGGGV